jgi:hypothetical protein
MTDPVRLSVEDCALITTALGLLLRETLRARPEDVADGYVARPEAVRELRARITGRAVAD